MGAKLRMVRIVMLLWITVVLLDEKYVSGASAQAGKWKKGHATFYGGSDASGTMGGSCGYGNLYSQGYGTQTAALSGPLYRGGESCGACFEIKCVGANAGCVGSNSIVITATNLCPTGSLGGWCDPPRLHFDMAEPAFVKLAAPVAGVIPVRFRRTKCQKSGGIMFNINGNANFNLVLVTNVGGSGDVKALFVKGSNTGWIALNRNWGQNWQTSSVLVGQALSFKVVTSDGASCVSWNVADASWQFGQTFSGSQFP